MPSTPSRAERVGARIASARKAKGLTQAELARQIGGLTTGDYVSRWERGQNMASIDNLERAAEVLDVTVSWLMFGD